MERNRKIFHRLAGTGFWIWLAMIFLISAWPGIPAPETKDHNLFRLDYLFHFGVHFLLAILFIVWKAVPGRFSTVVRVLLPFAGLMIAAILDEFIQILIPGRSFNPVDMMYNLLGIVSGMACIPLVAHGFSKRHRLKEKLPASSGKEI